MMKEFYDEKLVKPALTVINEVCATKKDQRVLIITNPEKDVMSISMALYDAALEVGAEPVLIVQKTKTLLDMADKSVIAAIGTSPDIVFSISANKLGKDEEAMKKPYMVGEQEYPHIFDYLLDGKKQIRSVWTPGLTIDMFVRTGCIDYNLLGRRCDLLCTKFENAEYVHVTAPAGTDLKIPVEGRKGLNDDGKFGEPGTGGNIPAGEVFISPVVGGKTGELGNIKNGCQGTIVYDGSMSINEGDIIIKNPIHCKVVDGFVTEVKGKEEASKLLSSITGAEEKANKMLADGIFSKDKAAEYYRNARNIGELGIGLNPAATISGEMLEDEKAFKTCHFAIGSNYDDDAPSFIHLDGVVRNPTITIYYKDGSSYIVEKDGNLSSEIEKA